MSDPSPRPAASLTLLRVAALFTFLACAMGSVVCATKSGASCPNWPGCRHTAITPQWSLSPVIEFTHRVVAISSGPLVLAAGVVFARRRDVVGWVRLMPWVALVGAFLSGVFGRMVIVSTLPTPLAAVDLFCALAAMTVMGVAVVRVTPTVRTGTVADRTKTDASLLVGRLALGGTVLVIALHVTGIFVSGKGSYTGCVGWPLWERVPGDLHPSLAGFRLVLAAVCALVVVATAALGLRVPSLRERSALLAVLFVGEMIVGVVIRHRGIDDPLAAAYSVLAVSLLSCLGLLCASAGVTRPHAAPPAPADPVGASSR